MEKYAFISYSHKDRSIVKDFVENLRFRHVNVWFDGELEYGSYWDNLIMDKLKNSSVVFIFISKRFAESKYCSKEFDIANDGKKTIIPILLDKEVDLPEDMQNKLHKIHHLSIYDHSEDFTYEDISKLCQLDAIKAISNDSYCSSGRGPERPIYSCNDYIDHVVFNSVKDHPKYGNEQSFLRIKFPDTDVFSSSCVNAFLRPGKEYEFEMLVHNNADFELNKTGKGIANSVRAIIKLPEMIRPSKMGEIVSLIRSTTASPVEVWDSIELCSDRPLFLKFVPGSAVFERAYDGKRRVLSMFLFSDDGVYITDFHKRGEASVPGGDMYAGRILFKVRTYEDSARIKYSKSILSLSGEPLEFVSLGEEFVVKTEFANEGDIDFRDTCFFDSFPDGMELVPGTTIMTNNANPNGLKMKDIIDKNGFNTGLYGPRAFCTITYKAKFTKGSGAKRLCGTVTHRGAIQSFFTNINVVGG